MGCEETAALVPSDGAHKAYDGLDVKASRNFHDARHDLGGATEGASAEMHQTGGGLLKPLIFGGLDGILTSFAIVAGAAGGSMAVPVVIIIGFSNIFADALASEYLKRDLFSHSIDCCVRGLGLIFTPGHVVY